MPMKDAQLYGQIANAEIAEVCLDRQPRERIFGQWYLDDSIDAPDFPAEADADHAALAKLPPSKKFCTPGDRAKS